MTEEYQKLNTGKNSDETDEKYLERYNEIILNWLESMMVKSYY